MQNPFASLHDAPVGAWARPQVKGMNDGRVSIVGTAALRCIAPLLGSLVAHSPIVGQNVTARGGLPPYTFGIGSGTLPLGVSFNSATGAITGSPQTGGDFGLIFYVQDARGKRIYSTAVQMVIAGAGGVNTGVWDSGQDWDAADWAASSTGTGTFDTSEFDLASFGS